MLGTRYQLGTLMVAWRELAWSLIPWLGVEVVVTSNADINARGCAWIPIAMSHCHASRGGAAIHLSFCLVDLNRVALQY